MGSIPTNSPVQFWPVHLLRSVVPRYASGSGAVQHFCDNPRLVQGDGLTRRLDCSVFQRYVVVWALGGYNVVHEIGKFPSHYKDESLYCATRHLKIAQTFHVYYVHLFLMFPSLFSTK